ncbi:hypothetical protein [Aliivibrio finisterrensis]|uniref:Glycosyltransferase RgtA/B/C/D-like domain-containing protein n=1 Tax=Aliivibrio finisterrensis TaxID=511998 RepID=A0ABY0I4Z9_9GAMM|nr:hypothetical protein [Aliivibrio finisterrensis]RYU59866.1 hypothetical protein ERW53_19760 [Aliivibrio finisterrensis]RYU79333.1 hypothetical protein ERW52_19605 [Aliivibrio finisterrensis]
MKNKVFLYHCFHLVIALLLALLLTVMYYKTNIGNIDPYEQFIYGDTINQSYSKLTDYRFLPIFFSLFVFFFIMLDKFKAIQGCVNKYSNVQGIQQSTRRDEIVNFIFDLFLVVIASYLSSKVLFSIIGGEYFSVFNRNVFIISIIVISLLLKQRALLTSQLFFAFSPLVYLNESYIFNGNTIHFPPSDELSYFIYFSSLITLVISINNVIKNNGKINFSFLVFVCVALIGEGSRVYDLDEYHIGELFTNFHQGITLNQSYYSEYISTKGFMHTFTGFLNYFFYDGGYTTIGLSSKLTAFIISMLLLGVLSFYYSNIVVLILLFLGLPLYGHYAPILIGICILTSKRVMNNSYNFLVISFIFTFAYFIYYNAFSVAFGLAIFPVLIYQLKEIFIHKYRPKKLHLILLVIFIFIFIFSFDYIVASLSYILSNSSSNLFYWGNPGSLKKLLVSNFWVLIPIALSFLIYTKYLVVNRDNILWVCFFVIFPFTILSYLEGRADGGFNRALSFSDFCVPMLFAFINSRSTELNKFSKLVFSMIFIMLFFFTSNTAFKKTSNIDDFYHIFSVKHIGNNHVLIDKGEVPNLGDGFIEKRRYQDLINEYSLIRKLSNDETFLIIDEYVTQSARYSIFDKLIPTLSHSILNVSSLKSQSNELIKVEKSNVKIIRVSNGVKRYHLFFNYLEALKFKLILFKGRDYLVAPELLSKIENELDFIIKSSFEQQYSTNNFGLLPIKWGNALNNQLPNLKYIRVDEMFSHSNSISTSNYINGNDPWFAYDVKNHLEPLNVDLINLNFSINKGTTCDSQLFWDDGNGFSEDKSMLFKIANGDNVIPVHMNFSWRDSGVILKFRIDIDSCNKKEVYLNKIGAYKYNFQN